MLVPLHDLECMFELSLTTSLIKSSWQIYMSCSYDTHILRQTTTSNDTQYVRSTSEMQCLRNLQIIFRRKGSSILYLYLDSATYTSKWREWRSMETILGSPYSVMETRRPSYTSDNFTGNARHSRVVLALLRLLHLCSVSSVFSPSMHPHYEGCRATKSDLFVALPQRCIYLHLESR
ncbi:hypothetical protein AcW1_009153 [Taiwanofungus camphoratus]|nr:hypothetical protein AcW1_009153 [Antrodia cinnamomea]